MSKIDGAPVFGIGYSNHSLATFCQLLTTHNFGRWSSKARRIGDR